MKLHLEPRSGISGDMFAASLIAVGGSVGFMKSQLDALSVLNQVEVRIARIEKAGLPAVKFDVYWNLDSVEERHYSDIEYLLKEASLDAEVKTLARTVFYRLAEAESVAHQCSIDDVHFHEVGALDSITDIVGCSALLVSLGVESVSSSVPVEGVGAVKFSHGVTDLPVPATRYLMQNMPIRRCNVNSELITPTGAAFLRVLVSQWLELPDFLPKLNGAGAGTKDFFHPNLLKVYLG
ncbi:MAG: LarC family nickel insertion protein [Candidatus Cloacimonetes bacterium]|nr:LarC family nickel insertion protein [Candidatus Cloacimonadota bacterium]